MTKRERLCYELRKATSEGNQNERVNPFIKAIFIESGIEPKEDYFVPFEPPIHDYQEEDRADHHPVP